MDDEDNDNELEELFASFDKQFADCEQKFSAIEENLKAFRAEQDESGNNPPESAE